MSGRAWLLHQSTEVVGEPVLDAVYLVRHKPYHWPVVAVTTATGAMLGSRMPTFTWLFTFGVAFLGMGVGMNLRTQFRLLARTATRLVLVDASSVDARPVAVANDVSPADVTVEPKWLWAHVTVAGVRHVAARHHVARLDALLRSVDATALSDVPHRDG